MDEKRRLWAFFLGAAFLVLMGLTAAEEAAQIAIYPLIALVSVFATVAGV